MLIGVGIEPHRVIAYAAPRHTLSATKAWPGILEDTYLCTSSTAASVDRNVYIYIYSLVILGLVSHVRASIHIFEGYR